MISRRNFLKMTGSSLAIMPLTLPIAPVQSATKQLPTRPIPSSGEPLAVLGFGQSAAFRSGDMDLSTKLLDLLIEMGGQFVDTGGSSQRVLGRFMNKRNALEELFLGTNIFSKTEDGMLNEIHQAQQVQGKKNLDLVQMRSLDDFDQQWSKLLEWKEAGLTRYVGFAMSHRNYYKPMMALMETGTADFIQVNYSMLEPEAADRLLPLAHDKGVAIVTNRPFVNGQYFPLVSGRQLPEWAQEFDCDSWAQFSLKYILAHPSVNCVLSETTKTKHAVDNLSAGFGRLPDESTRERMIGLVRSFM